ncbi:O-antigen ligase family protein [Sphingomonas mesophila]|uniref:O-antigen ligase family protein n=1 Tax=Sphingomonas mesophila TaxID=2303576 RepID=UPI000E56BC1D|nr:O-antigen ligase family protein [Sphingomonas mesophila]
MSFALLKNLAFLEAMIAIGYAIFYALIARPLKREIGFKPFILFSGLAAACFLAPNLWILHLVLIGTVPLLARTREQIGLVLLVALLATPGLTLDLRAGTVPIFGLGAQGSLALGALVAMLLRPGKSPKLPFIVDLPAILVLILLVVVGASDTSFTHWLRQTAYIGVSWGLSYYVVTRTLVTPERIHRACIWLTAAASMLSVVVLYERASFWPLYAALNDKYGIVRGPLELIVKMREGLLRAEGPMGEATAMGFVLVIGLAAAFVSHRAFRSRMAYWAIIGLIGFGLQAPQSRGGWLGAAVAIVAMMVFRLRRAGAISLSLAVLGVGALVYSLLSRGGTGSASDGSVDYRAQLWRRGLEEFRERPLLGDSYRDVVAQMSDLIQGEGIVDFVNSYLYFALLVGSVGLVMFVAFFVIPSARIWLARQNLERGSLELDAAAFCFGTIASAAVMFALTSFIPRAALLVMIAAGLAGIIAIKRGRSLPSDI